MSEQNQPQDPDTQSGATGSGSTPNGDSHDAAGELLDEVRELGQQLEAAFRAAIESERTKQLQRDLMGGVKELTTQVRSAVKTLQEHPSVQQASERGREAINRAQQSKTAHDLQETLVSGIAQLNVQLRKLVDRLEQPVDTSASATQHVPVEPAETGSAPTYPSTYPPAEEPPATGETTRLDDNDQISS